MKVVQVTTHGAHSGVTKKGRPYIALCFSNCPMRHGPTRFGTCGSHHRFYGPLPEDDLRKRRAFKFALKHELYDGLGLDWPEDEQQVIHTFRFNKRTAFAWVDEHGIRIKDPSPLSVNPKSGKATSFPATFAPILKLFQLVNAREQPAAVQVALDELLGATA